MAQWQVNIYSVYGTDIKVFDTKDDAIKFALETEKDTDHVYGTELFRTEV